MKIIAQRLTRTELVRRHLGTFKSEFDFITNGSTIPSFLYEKYQMFYVDLLERLKVDMAVLDYNYLRLNNYMKLLMFERMRIFNISLDNISKINEKEYPLALEFFLQFDGKCYSSSSFVFKSYFSSQYVLYENVFTSLCTSSYIK